MSELKHPRRNYRGIKKCPKCKSYNGHRSEYCKNKLCRELLQKDKECISIIESSKIKTNSGMLLYSVRSRNIGPDYRGFVELSDMDNDWIQSNSFQLNCSGYCYVKNCTQTISDNDSANCPHIEASLITTYVAETLPINRSALNLIKVDDIKEEIFSMMTTIISPLVQRVSRNVFAVKTNKEKNYPLGYLHVFFTIAKKRYFCNCEKFRRSRRKKKINNNLLVNSKSPPNTFKCTHFYLCICAFASNTELLNEFEYFINLVLPNDTIENIKLNENEINDSYVISMLDSESNIIELSNEIPLIGIENDPISPCSTQTIEFQDGNTLMMEFQTDEEDWKSQDNNSDESRINVSDVILLKGKDEEMVDVCDVFLTDSTKEKNDYEKPVDIQIMLADTSDVLNLTNYTLQEVPAKLNNSLSKKNMPLNTENSKTSNNLMEDNCDNIITNKILNSELSILKDGYNSFEIMTLEQYNCLINKNNDKTTVKDMNENNEVNNSNLNVSSTLNDCNNEFLFVGLNDNVLDKINQTNCVNSLSVENNDSNICDVNNLMLPPNIKDKNLLQLSNDQKNNFINGNIFLVNNDNLLRVGEDQTSPKSTETQVLTSVASDIPILSNFNSENFNIINLPFIHWLISVTEQLNEMINYRIIGNIEPITYQIPHEFFDCLISRMCPDKTKRRLPNSISEYTKNTGFPQGKFTKYTWNIINVKQVQLIFDTPHMVLKISQFFRQKQDGTFFPIEEPDSHKQSKIFKNHKKSKKPTKILPKYSIVYLKVGNTSPDQKVPTPFCIEWTPDILPISKFGELRLKFEYGHKTN